MPTVTMQKPRGNPRRQNNRRPRRSRKAPALRTATRNYVKKKTRRTRKPRAMVGFLCGFHYASVRFLCSDVRHLSDRQGKGAAGLGFGKEGVGGEICFEHGESTAGREYRHERSWERSNEGTRRSERDTQDGRQKIARADRGTTPVTSALDQGTGAGDQGRQAASEYGHPG